jgi:hypothetical protein
MGPTLVDGQVDFEFAIELLKMHMMSISQLKSSHVLV